MLTELQEWRAEMLARDGWFAHRAIAARILGQSFEAVSDADVRAVSTHLFKQRISVRDGHNMLTRPAASRARALLKTRVQRRRTRQATV